jgi:hypothetical protein
MTAGRIPKPYINDVPEEGADKIMEYTKLKTMDIGARPSGLPGNNLNGIRGLDHVGESAGGKK